MRQGDGGRGSAVRAHELGSRWLVGVHADPAVGMGPACRVGLETHTQATEGRNVDRIASSRFWVRSISRVELNT